MKTIDNLQVTKFFDVKTPVGINQRGENLNNYSIGVDLYMPKFTPKFIKALCESNKKIYPNIEFIEIYSGDAQEPKYLKQINIKLLSKAGLRGIGQTTLH